MEYVFYSNELAHFGILGMKWGVRRFQNPDGTLTAAGRRRIAKLSKKRDAAVKAYDKTNDMLAQIGSASLNDVYKTEEGYSEEYYKQLRKYLV